MIFNALIAAVKAKNFTGKKTNCTNSRSKYIMEKYQERSITNRYFK